LLIWVLLWWAAYNICLRLIASLQF
jgi:hypothetical protein